MGEKTGSRKRMSTNGLHAVSIPAVLSSVHAGEPIAEAVEIIELGARDVVIRTDANLEEREKIVLRLQIADPNHSEILQLDEDMNRLQGRNVNAQGVVVKSAPDGENYLVHVHFSGHFMISRSRTKKSETVESQ